MTKFNYNKYFSNLEIDSNIKNNILSCLEKKDLSWPFGVTKKFEAKISKFLKVKYALAHCNGTSAMYAAMFAVGLGDGDEVICPTYTFWASVSPAINLKAKVVFCDINNDTLIMNLDSVRKLINDKTRVIIVPHLWGGFCDINKLRKICNEFKHKIYIIEDASHCFGASYMDKFLSTIGDVGIFSLQAGKPLVAGEGGMLVTNNYQIYERAVYFGHYERIKFLSKGKYSKYSKTGGGFKFRIHPLASALALAQLKTITKKIQLHNTLMFYFISKLKTNSQIKVIECKESRFTYGGRFGLRVAIKLNKQQKINFLKECSSKKMGVSDEYIPLLHQEAFFVENKAKNVGSGIFKITESFHNNLIALPVFYSGDKNIIDHYVKDLFQILKKSNR